jgi:hypothetical protein
MNHSKGGRGGRPIAACGRERGLSAPRPAQGGCLPEAGVYPRPGSPTVSRESPTTGNDVAVRCGAVRCGAVRSRCGCGRQQADTEPLLPGGTPTGAAWRTERARSARASPGRLSDPSRRNHVRRDVAERPRALRGLSMSSRRPSSPWSSSFTSSRRCLLSLSIHSPHSSHRSHRYPHHHRRLAAAAAAVTHDRDTLRASRLAPPPLSLWPEGKARHSQRPVPGGGWAVVVSARLGLEPRTGRLPPVTHARSSTTDWRLPATTHWPWATSERITE